MRLFNLNEKKYDITFISRKDSAHFAEPILSELKKKYVIQHLSPEHKYQYNHWQVKGEVIWVEWAHKFAREVSKKKWKHKKVIVRLHRYEIDTTYMDSIKWENIDLLIFVNPELENLFKNKYKDVVQTITIPNALDISKFPYNKPTKENNILAYSMFFSPVKAYDQLIKIFSNIININTDLYLTIVAQESENIEYQQYFHDCKNLVKNLNLDSNIKLISINDDQEILKILLKNNAIISYSNLESFHYAFAEGLLSGLEGFCRGWRQLEPSYFWKDWCYFNEKDFINAVIKWSNSSLKDRVENSKKSRQYIINNYSSLAISKIYENYLFTS